MNARERLSAAVTAFRQPLGTDPDEPQEAPGSPEALPPEGFTPERAPVPVEPPDGGPEAVLRNHEEP